MPFTLESLKVDKQVIAGALSEGGEKWLESLPETFELLLEKWEATYLGNAGVGSRSFVSAVELKDGTQAVLKMEMPSEDFTNQTKALIAAGGKGQVLVLACDEKLGAALLEKLGESLLAADYTVEEKLSISVATLEEAWQPSEGRPGENRAQGLSQLARELGAGTRWSAEAEEACRLAETLAENPREGFIIHGDPHAENLLRAKRSKTGFLLIDPWPAVGEKAYDLGIVLRAWNDEICEKPERAWEYCTLLAEQSGEDFERIWAWGYLERVSTGLYLTGRGNPAEGAKYLQAAHAILGVEGAGKAAGRNLETWRTPKTAGGQERKK